MKEYENIKKMISTGDDSSLIESMGLLKDCFISLECDPDPIYLLEYRFNKNAHYNRLGLLDSDDYTLENNRIVKALLDFVDQVKRGDNFENLKPLKIQVRNKKIKGKSIDVELGIFNEVHEIKIKTNWFYFFITHNGNEIYRRINWFNYHSEVHEFSIFAKKNSELRGSFSTAYDVWSATFKEPKLAINEKSIL